MDGNVSGIAQGRRFYFYFPSVRPAAPPS